MIDLHTHILPGVDDGTKDEEEATEIIRNALHRGIRSFVLTPHIFFPSLNDGLLQHIEHTFSSITETIKEREPSVRLYLGAEIFYYPDLLELLETYPVTINRGKYFLVEFGLTFLPEKQEKILENFFNAQMKGYIPILAHPERNRTLMKNPDILEEFERHGILAQVNAGSFLGIFGRFVKQFAFQMLKHNMVHVIASDVHNLYSRPHLLVDAVEKLSGRFPDQDVTALVERNPRKIVQNETVEVPEIIPFSKKRFTRFLNSAKSMFQG
jgi:protein-tyrosine phosphatase